MYNQYMEKTKGVEAEETEEEETEE